MVRLTEFSHGAGCGCKIAPDVLEQILHTATPGAVDPRLLVGNSSRDDAAVVDLGNGTGIISTTDFFMPVVDDAFDFGRIAAANAISDVYAMGGSPLMAIAILGWPVSQLPPELAGRVIDGGRAVCDEAGITLAGGHSIDSPEPIFGLAVTGQVPVQQVVRNDSARAGDLLYLTKPLGIGILTSAAKQGRIRTEDLATAVANMVALNKAGEAFARIDGVHAMTDVTGFGLIGHLLEVCRGSGVAAVLHRPAVPELANLDAYLGAGCVPGGTYRNIRAAGESVQGLSQRDALIFCDPQTSGGLLVSVAAGSRDRFESVAWDQGLGISPIGYLEARSPDSRLVSVVDDVELAQPKSSSMA